MIIVEREIAGKVISIETGKVAKQANGSVIVRCGESVVLVTACLGPDKQADFLPLTIDYVEKGYAAGKIPGGYFKREGRLSEHETLVSRLIDRPCRPLFPEGFGREVQVIATVLSADENCPTDILALCGASAALTVSDIPFDGPAAAVRVARINGKLVINPPIAEFAKSEISFVLAGTKDAIMMVEGGAREVPEAEVLDALFFAHQEMQPIIAMQQELREKVGLPKVALSAPDQTKAAMSKEIQAFMDPLIAQAVRVKEKQQRKDALNKAQADAVAKFVKEDDENKDDIAKLITKVFENRSYDLVREMAFKEKRRIDGRDFTTVRPISIEVGYLPRAHGSTLFTRGETQAIVATTLGLSTDVQYLDPLIGTENTKRFMLHYNFPPFSVGEARPMRGTGRREYGHGALAERAIKAVMPDEKKFPYVTRIVSEITESNGSSSMASVCGGTLSLLDAGVPIKAHVAGIAMGLMKDGNDCVILTDILGDEDHLGDMDFKVCGSEQGITALQMDIKIKGLDKDTMTKALNQARDARLHILNIMKAAIQEPRKALSKHAPKIEVIKINPDKIRDVVGPGGKVIKSITESQGVKIDIADDGTISVAAVDPDRLAAAINIIKGLTAEAEVGKIYKGVVKRIADFGAFVEILPGVDGLVHISQFSDDKIRSVNDVVQEGDELVVKVLAVDAQGKIRLSHKEAMQELS
jgi:polyribonucleotide nucleotidyltransferase